MLLQVKLVLVALYIVTLKISRTHTVHTWSYWLSHICVSSQFKHSIPKLLNHDLFPHAAEQAELEIKIFHLVMSLFRLAPLSFSAEIKCHRETLCPCQCFVNVCESRQVLEQYLRVLISTVLIGYTYIGTYFGGILATFLGCKMTPRLSG